jgi:general secretion pathway protein G
MFMLISLLRSLRIGIAVALAIALVGKLLSACFLGEGTDTGGNIRIYGDFSGITSAIKMFCLDTGRLPSTLQDLVARPKSLSSEAHWQQLLNEVPVDPWQNEYHYVLDPTLSNGFGIYSTGVDGVTVSAGNDPDDYNTWGSPDSTRSSRFSFRSFLSRYGSALTIGLAFTSGLAVLLRKSFKARRITPNSADSRSVSHAPYR